MVYSMLAFSKLHTSSRPQSDVDPSPNAWRWTNDDVRRWLRLNNLTSFIDFFCTTLHANGSLLMTLSDEDLMKLSRHPDFNRLKRSITSLQQLMHNHCGRSFSESATLHDDMSSTSRIAAGSQQQGFTTNWSVAVVRPPSSMTSATLAIGPTGNRSAEMKDDDKKRSGYLDFFLDFSVQRFIVAFLIMIVTTVFTCWMVILADERSPDRTRYPPLPDIVLSNVARVTWAPRASEIVILILFGVFATILFFHIERLVLIKRVLLLISILNSLRAIAMCCTSLSVVSPHLRCLPKDIEMTSRLRLKRVMQLLLYQGLELYGADTCGDYMYSGHTCVIVLLALFITTSMPKKFWPVTCISWLLGVFGMFCMLVGHFHYTVDVIIALIITWGLFVHYNTMCHCPTLFQPKIRARLQWYIPMFYFFENQNTCHSLDEVQLRLPDFVIRVRQCLSCAVSNRHPRHRRLPDP